MWNENDAGLVAYFVSIFKLFHHTFSLDATVIWVLKISFLKQGSSTFQVSALQIRLGTLFCCSKI